MMALLDPQKGGKPLRGRKRSFMIPAAMSAISAVILD
jgi:hypothetical protein